MAAYQQLHTYLNNHYEGMDPEQLILLLFKGALTRMKLAREGIEEGNIQKKGENLSKVIAIISELNASVD
ncbi:MAG TPA: flagellar export chaperone FliS, partial [Desulfobacter sp.]|nr:flagellar export chaperone FliS [Desulfobacter sp.]